MGQIVDDIMFEIENTNTRQSVINSHIAEKIVRGVLLKHLEPQKKAEVCQHKYKEYFEDLSEQCKLCGLKRLKMPEPQQEDKKIKPLKFIENGMTDYVYYEKINEIINHINLHLDHKSL